MRQSLINYLIFVLFLIISPVYSITNNIRVDADYLEINSSANVLVASKNVIASDNKLMLQSQHFYYSQASRNMTIKGPFLITGKKVNFKGRDLTYRGKKGTGKAYDVDGKVGRYVFKADRISINNNHVALKNALYSSCSEKPKHYHVVADEIEYYSYFGLMVLHDVDFYVMENKVFWLPYFVVGSNTYKIISQQTAIPEIGYNDKDGLYIKERLGYVFNDRNTGTVDLSYKSKKGTRYGFSHQYIHSPSAINYLYVHYNSQYSKSKAFELDYILENKWVLQSESIKDVSKSDKVTDIFDGLLEYTNQKDSKYYLSSELEFSRRKLIGYEHVNFAPRLKVNLNPVELKHGAFFSSNIEWARLIENNPDYEEMKSYKNRREYNFYLNRPIYFNDKIKSLLTPSIRYSFINSINDFNKNVGSMYYSCQFTPDMKFTLLYEHLFHQKGERSFRYESFEIFDLDFIEVYFEHKLKPFDYNLRYKYATDDFDVLDSFVEVGYSLDCIRFGLGYRLLQNEGLNEIKLNEVKFSVNIF